MHKVAERSTGSASKQTCDTREHPIYLHEAGTQDTDPPGDPYHSGDAARGHAL